MSIQFDEFPKLSALLKKLFAGDRFRSRNPDWRDTEDFVRQTVVALDVIIMGENFCSNNNLQLPGGVHYISDTLNDRITAVSAYLETYPSRIFKFSRTERQTFLFVLENIADYFQSRRHETAQRDGADIFQDFKFWIENFIKIFDQKLNGTAVMIEEKADLQRSCPLRSEFGVLGTGPWLLFQTEDQSWPLVPFVILGDGQPVLLKELSHRGPQYRTPDGGAVIPQDRSGLIALLAEFCLLNFDFSHARLLSEQVDPAYAVHPDVLDTMETAARLCDNGKFLDSHNLIESLPLKDIDSLLLYHLRVKNLEGLGRRRDLEQQLLRLTAEYPGSAYAFEKLGDLYKRERKLEMAHKAYVKALNLTAQKRLAGKLKTIKDGLKDKKSESDSQPSDTFYDLVDRVKQEPVGLVGREQEFRQMVEILISPGRNNVMIIGDGGVGKTTLVYALAESVADGSLPDGLKERKIREINFVSLVTGSKYRGQFEEKVLRVLNELKKQQAILVLEDIHMMVSTGTPRGTSLDLVNMLKPFMRERSIQVIATTNYEEYKNSLEKDSALMGFFHRIALNEMSPRETRLVLSRRAEKISAEQAVDISGEIIGDIAESARRNIKGRRLPDAALLVLARCVAKVQLKRFYGQADRSAVEQEDVVEVLSDMLNLPEAQVSITMRNRLQRLQQALRNHIVGQDEAIQRISASVATSKLNLDIKSNRPDGVFLFVGPTGVGKTETAIALTRALYGSEDYLIRIDMSEYMERFTYSRFVGAAPGYVGYYDSNQLTDRVRQNPFSVILLDEFEKADAQLLNIFLQVFDAGRLTDARGNLVDFSHTTIIMTSNVGTSLFSQNRMGYQSELAEPSISRSTLVKSLKRFFSPEFLNRIDEIVVFNKLGPDDIRRIIEIQLQEVRSTLARQGKELVIEPSVMDHIIDRYYSAEYGARNISRGLKTEVLERVAGLSLREGWPEATHVICRTGASGVQVRLAGHHSPDEGMPRLLEKEDER